MSIERTEPIVSQDWRPTSATYGWGREEIDDFTVPQYELFQIIVVESLDSNNARRASFLASQIAAFCKEGGNKMFPRMFSTGSGRIIPLNRFEEVRFDIESADGSFTGDDGCVLNMLFCERAVYEELSNFTPHVLDFESDSFGGDLQHFVERSLFKTINDQIGVFRSIYDRRVSLRPWQPSRNCDEYLEYLRTRYGW